MTGITTSLVLVVTISVCLCNTRATVTVSPEGQQPMPCNSCCQGPAGSQGMPGIPGVPGSNGINGIAGAKGERGESITGGKGDSGLPGEKGDIGNPGLKGESGVAGFRGPPGKVGPVGIAGAVGSSGTPGVKGQKGEMGQSRLSAFSAVRSTSIAPSAGQALPFQQVHTNVGNDFVAGLGRFTCEIPGIYLFTYSIMTLSDTAEVKLMKNEVVINSVYRTNENNYDGVSNTAVLQLAAEDQIWLKCRIQGSQIYSDSSLYTTFSGVIIHEV
ncbi:uncharacterized protein [Amphiura filiformis]|uniref:uncharacterized protein n=1 Tax=Amphiura filiformis TaxID=82378 RepID=UPI003B2104AE